MHTEEITTHSIHVLLHYIQKNAIYLLDCLNEMPVAEFSSVITTEKNRVSRYIISINKNTFLLINCIEMYSSIK